MRDTITPLPWLIIKEWERGTLTEWLCHWTPLYKERNLYTSVFSFCYMYVLMLLYMCPHAVVCVCFISTQKWVTSRKRVLFFRSNLRGGKLPKRNLCVLILLYVCPHDVICVLILMYVSSYCYICVLMLSEKSRRSQRKSAKGAQGVLKMLSVNIFLLLVTKENNNNNGISNKGSIFSVVTTSAT